MPNYRDFDLDIQKDNKDSIDFPMYKETKHATCVRGCLSFETENCFIES